MTSFISCYDLQTRKLKSFEVDPNVAVYIKQLETYIKFPDMSKLKEEYAYGFRFPEQVTTDGT
jgi:hypothetical protein